MTVSKIPGHVNVHPIFLPPPALLDISRLDGSPWVNPTYDTSNANWSSTVVGGARFDGSKAHPFEWVSVLNPTVQQDDEVGVAGTVINPEDSSADLPFTHPFGNDYEFYIYPDAAYESLLAPSNKNPPADAPDIATAISSASALGLDGSRGVLALEVDGALVPPDFRPEHGERVAVYGKWIVDAGHPDFHTEIHPPLLMARARTVDDSGNDAARDATATTLMHLWSRPYQSGQLFATGGDTNLVLQDYASDIAETWGSIQAFPPVFPKPFDGIHLVAFTVRPPVESSGVTSVVEPTVLECSYHFTVNGSCGVEVLPSPADPHAVMVVLALNPVNYPSLPELPHTFDTYSISDLLKEAGNVADISWYEQAWLDIKSDVQVRRYAAPSLSATADTQNIVPFTPLASIPRQTVSTDTTQPFPVYGWLKLKWVTQRLTVDGGRLHEVVNAVEAKTTS